MLSSDHFLHPLSKRCSLLWVGVGPPRVGFLPGPLVPSPGLAAHAPGLGGDGEGEVLLWSALQLAASISIPWSSSASYAIVLFQCIHPLDEIKDVTF